MKAGEEISTGNVRSAKEAFRDVGISAASGFITGAFGAKFPGAHRLTEGVVDTAVSAGERLAYAVFDDSMSWDEKRAYAFDPGQMVADFVTGVVIGEILDGIMAATQNKLRSIFANYDATMREALESGSNPKNVFPENPDDLLPEIPRNKATKANGTTSQTIQTSDNIRIRAEQHPLLPGETYNPRHHGVHYHVEYKVDPTKSWNNKNNVKKWYPEGYTPGAGSGFIPGEPFPE